MSTPKFHDKITETFINVDDFCLEFEREFKKYSLESTSGTKKRNRKASLSDSEIINLSSGKINWQIPLGEYPGLTKKGIAITGAENYGGPVVTAGGILVIASTPDQKIGIFNKRTGKLLWEAMLPAAGFATPATYLQSGKQYIVIASGGGKLGARSGDAYIAFALR